MFQQPITTASLSGHWYEATLGQQTESNTNYWQARIERGGFSRGSFSHTFAGIVKRDHPEVILQGLIVLKPS